MTIDNKYTAKFGVLHLSQGPKNNFLWTAATTLSGELFSGQLPIYIFTKGPEILPQTISLAEAIVLDIDYYLEKSVRFIQHTLTTQRDKYKIRKEEYGFLKLPVHLFPLESPELVFWEHATEWTNRFAEGKFAICDPYGIAVNYEQHNPVSVDNLEDSEDIGNENQYE